LEPKRYEEIETEIKSYCRDLNQLNWFNEKIELYEKQCNEIMDDIGNTNISFRCDIRGVSYDTPVVQTSGTPGLERMIDIAFDKMERELEVINKKITDTKIQIRTLEEKTAKLKYCIGLLSGEAQSFLELYYYKKRKSYVSIGLELNVSHSTVGRIKKEVLQQIDLLLNYLKN